MLFMIIVNRELRFENVLHISWYWKYSSISWISSTERSSNTVGIFNLDVRMMRIAHRSYIIASWTTMQSVIVFLPPVDNSQLKKVISFLLVSFVGHRTNYLFSFSIHHPLHNSLFRYERWQNSFFNIRENSAIEPSEIQDIAVALTSKHSFEIAQFD